MSRISCLFFLCIAAILLGEPAGALRGRAEMPRAGDEDRGAGNEGAFFYVECSLVKSLAKINEDPIMANKIKSIFNHISTN